MDARIEALFEQAGCAGQLCVQSLRLGIGAVNASSARLGLASTVIATDLRTMINSIGRDAGFATGRR